MAEAVIDGVAQVNGADIHYDAVGMEQPERFNRVVLDFLRGA